MRYHLRFTIASAILAFTLTAQSQTLPAGVQKITSVEGITEYAWPNGLHVLLFPDSSKPEVTVNITYLVGSRHEAYGETGMAHLMEHMLYLKTKDGRDVKKELADHGADFNGSTSWDRTNFFETVKASDENLRWAVLLEADRMTNMRIEKALLDTEMTVVRNEFEMRENSPAGILEERVLETAYLYHNYGKMPIGSRSDIENVPIERLAAFYHKYYQPDDAVLTIAGQFDQSKALALVAQSFGALAKPTRFLDKTYTVEPTQDGERSVMLRRVGENPQIDVLYHTPAAAHPDTAVLDVLTTILGDAPSGRLYKALVDNKKAVSVGMDVEELHDPGFAMGHVRLRQDQSLDDARQILLKTVEGFAAEPPSEEEVARAKTRLLKEYELALANTKQIGVVLSEYLASGDWRLLFLSRDEIKKVTPADVTRVAKAYFKESNRTLGEFIPTKGPDRAEIPATPDVAVLLKDYKGGETISEGEAFNPTPANIEGRVVRHKIGGLELAVLPKKTRGGTVVARIRLDFGDEHASFGKSVVGQLTGALLMRGTKNRSRQQIQDEMDRLKAHITVSGTATDASASIETTEGNLEGALRLVAEMLRDPAFQESEIEQLRQQRIAGAEASRTEPMALGRVEMDRRLRNYPRGDVRYVSTPDEQIEDLKAVTLDQVRQFHAQFYGASHGEVVVVGQCDAAAVERLMTDLLGDWKSPAPFTRVSYTYKKNDVADRKIETPDKQNALFLAGLDIKMSDDDADYPAMVMANYLFGGSMSSRLFTRIRNREGLSYGVGSGFAAPALADGGLFMVQAISAPQNTPKVEASFKDELAKVLRDGFNAEEVSAAKKAWLDEEMVERSQDGALASTLVTRERFGRTMKWDEALEAKVSALSAEEISAAFRKCVDGGGLVVVKAGDFRKAGVLQ